MNELSRGFLLPRGTTFFFLHCAVDQTRGSPAIGMMFHTEMQYHCGRAVVGASQWSGLLMFLFLSAFFQDIVCNVTGSPGFRPCIFKDTDDFLAYLQPGMRGNAGRGVVGRKPLFYIAQWVAAHKCKHFTKFEGAALLLL